MDFEPYFWNERDGQKLSTQIKQLRLSSRLNSTTFSAALNSSLFFWWFVVLSDCRHLNLREIRYFPLGLNDFNKNIQQELTHLVQVLMHDFKSNSCRKSAYYKTTGQVKYDEFYPKLSKSIIDEIDRALAQHYGFTDEELDFIINYDIKYRMGNALFDNTE